MFRVQLFWIGLCLFAFYYLSFGQGSFYEYDWYAMLTIYSNMLRLYSCNFTFVLILGVLGVGLSALLGSV